MQTLKVEKTSESSDSIIVDYNLYNFKYCTDYCIM